jgi:hypothetical protein
MRFRVSSVPDSFPKNMLTEVIKEVEQVANQEIFDTGYLDYDEWLSQGYNHKYSLEHNRQTRTAQLHLLEIEINSMDELEKILELTPIHKITISPTFIIDNSDPQYTIDMGCY